jgi:hypothetical protein
VPLVLNKSQYIGVECFTLREVCHNLTRPSECEAGRNATNFFRPPSRNGRTGIPLVAREGILEIGPSAMGGLGDGRLVEHFGLSDSETKHLMAVRCAIVAPMDQAFALRPQSHNHHTVPQFWLRQFADSRGFLKEFDVPKVDLIARRTHVKQATVHQDLYVLDSWNATHDIDERQILGPIEDKAARALRTLWKAQDLSTVWPLPQRARNDIATFLAASVIRTPKYRQHADAHMERQVASSNRRLDATNLFRSGVIVGDPDDMARLGRLQGLWKEGDKAPSNVRSNYMRAELPKLARHLFNQRWVLMRAPDTPFVISDNPVALTGQPMTSGPPTFYSVNSLDSRMSLTALSRDLLLITDWHPPEVLSSPLMRHEPHWRAPH